MHPLINIAVKAARQAGKTILQKSYRIDQLRADVKGARDFVTNIDILAERQIVEIIHESYPNHAILAEEIHTQPGTDYEWIIDPLDGTTNYMHGVPVFGVSIAARRNGRLEHAVIYDPVHEEMFTASRGEGAMLNNRRIRASAICYLEQSLIGTGFPFRDSDKTELWVDIFRDLAKKTSGVRRPGAAALDLASVACGRYEGFWESGLKVWDIAAGALLIQESGGIITDFDGEQDFLENGTVVAASSIIYDQLFEIIHKNYRVHQKSK